VPSFVPSPSTTGTPTEPNASGIISFPIMNERMILENKYNYGNNPLPGRRRTRIRYRTNSGEPRFLVLFTAGIFLLITLCAIPACSAEDEENVYYDEDQVDDAYYEAVTDDTDDAEDDEYAFYDNEIQDEDDFTANTYEEQLLKTNVSSIIDVVLCVLCMFFWVLWLVGTIFPNRIQDLYRNEGVVVKADVLESCVMNDGGNSEHGAKDLESDITFNGMDLPTYTAIVSYVVPSRVARSGKGVVASGSKTKHDPTPSNEQPQSCSANEMMRTLSHKVSAQHLAAEYSPTTAASAGGPSTFNYGRSETPPRPPRGKQEDGKKALHVNTRPSPTNCRPPNPYGKTTSLFDAFTKSFDSTTNNSGTDPINTSKGGMSPMSCIAKESEPTYYKYNNKYIHYTYDDDGEDDDDDDVDAEQIGSFFQSFGLFQKPKPTLVKKEKPAGGAVRVKKRFETSELLAPGFKNVEIILLPGNPSSGVLKSEFEEEDFMLNDGGFFGSAKDDTACRHGPPDKNEVRFGDVYSAMIGVVLATVSTIGAVHSALTLPYKIRVYGWLILIFSTCFMWPTAMLTYKTVNRVRIFTMNKIISFEPCGEKTGLYGLNKLPNAKLTSCSGGSANNSGTEGATNYVIMLDENGREKSGVFPNDEEGSAVSSLSDGRLRQLT